LTVLLVSNILLRPQQQWSSEILSEESQLSEWIGDKNAILFLSSAHEQLEEEA
jgi:hypothetical protein